MWNFLILLYLFLILSNLDIRKDFQETAKTKPYH